jgi:hypothetical protein
VGGLDLVDVILTDAGADPDDLQALREAGATVVVAGEHASALTGDAVGDQTGVGVS